MVFDMHRTLRPGWSLFVMDIFVCVGGVYVSYKAHTVFSTEIRHNTVFRVTPWFNNSLKGENFSRVRWNIKFHWEDGNNLNKIESAMEFEFLFQERRITKFIQYFLSKVKHDLIQNILHHEWIQNGFLFFFKWKKIKFWSNELLYCSDEI